MGDAAEMPRCMELIGSNQKPRAGFDDVGRGTLVEQGGAGARQCDVQTTDRLALVGDLVSAHALAFVGQCDPEIAQVLQDRLLLRVRGCLNCPLAVRCLFPRVYLGHRRLRCAGISRAWNFGSAGSPARGKINVPLTLFCVERWGGFRVGGHWGCPRMPSAAYLRRQADICLRLAAIASDEAASSRFLAVDQDYTTQG